VFTGAESTTLMMDQLVQIGEGYGESDKKGLERLGNEADRFLSRQAQEAHDYEARAEARAMRYNEEVALFRKKADSVREMAEAAEHRAGEWDPSITADTVATVMGNSAVGSTDRTVSADIYPPGEVGVANAFTMGIDKSLSHKKGSDYEWGLNIMAPPSSDSVSQKAGNSRKPAAGVTKVSLGGPKQSYYIINDRAYATKENGEVGHAIGGAKSIVHARSTNRDGVIIGELNDAKPRRREPELGETNKNMSPRMCTQKKDINGTMQVSSEPCKCVDERAFRHMNSSESSNLNPHPSVFDMTCTKGDLHSGSAWCAAENTEDQWYQLDLHQDYELGGISTQGRADVPQWVTRYRVQYKNETDIISGAGWTDVLTHPDGQGNPQEEAFSHSDNQYVYDGCPDVNNIPELIELPRTAKQCSGAMSCGPGSSDNKIATQCCVEHSNGTITVLKKDQDGTCIDEGLDYLQALTKCESEDASLCTKAQVDERVACGVDESCHFDDNYVWLLGLPFNKSTTFYGNTDQTTERKNYFPKLIVARYIRVIPLTWHNHMSMRVGLLDCAHHYVPLPPPPPPPAFDPPHIPQELVTWTNETKYLMGSQIRVTFHDGYRLNRSDAPNAIEPDWAKIVRASESCEADPVGTATGEPVIVKDLSKFSNNIHPPDIKPPPSPPPVPPPPAPPLYPGMDNSACGTNRDPDDGVHPDQKNEEFIMEKRGWGTCFSCGRGLFAQQSCTSEAKDGDFWNASFALDNMFHKKAHKKISNTTFARQVREINDVKMSKTCSEADSFPWWRVDLGEGTNHTIDRIVIFNT